MSETTSESTHNEFGPNLFPNNSRRRIPGVLYLIIGVACGVIWLTRSSGEPVLVNGGLLLAAAILLVAGVYSIFVGSNLIVDEEDALTRAAGVVGKPVGHASAQMGWRGWASRPTWRILWYSAEDPPEFRGFVLVDGHDGTVLESIVQENPENWDSLDGSLDH